jgi:hypothetical protein
MQTTRVVAGGKCWCLRRWYSKQSYGTAQDLFYIITASLTALQFVHWRFDKKRGSAFLGSCFVGLLVRVGDSLG